MLATSVRFALLLELLSWIGLATWLRTSEGWTLAGAIVLATLGGPTVRLAIVAFSLATTYVARSPREAAERLGGVASAGLLASEWRAMLLNNYLWLPFEKQLLRPDPPLAVARPMPVIVVHGYLSNRGTVSSLVRALDAAGAGPVIAPSLAPVFAPIAEFEAGLAGAIEACCAASGHEKVVLVCHSMGGLIAREYLARRGPGRVARLVTLGSPHHGTVVARLGIGSNAAQMRPESAYLRGLAAREGSGPGIPALSVWTLHDNLVAPQDSSRLPWAREAAIHGVAHLAMLADPRVHRLVLAEIAAARAQLEQREDFLGVAGHVGIVDHVGDASLRVDDEGDAVGHAHQRLGRRE